MKRAQSIFLTLTAAAAFVFPSFAREVKDSVEVHFRQSKITLDRNYMRNAGAFDDITARIHRADSTPGIFLKEVRVAGGASPEGSVRFNNWLSRRRAETILSYLRTVASFPLSPTDSVYYGRDWAGLHRLILADPGVPFQSETEELVAQIVGVTRNGETESQQNLQKLKNLRSFVPYLYLYGNLFPELRSSKVVLVYDQLVMASDSLIKYTDVRQCLPAISEIRFPDIEFLPSNVVFPESKFYMALKTNMLADVAAIPSVGAEFYLGKNISVLADWSYAWWKNDRRNRYWRLYGGDLCLRWWFGREAHAKPLTGHHLGIYLQAVTYDFEWGKTGHMGGLPHGNLFDRCHTGGGVEYGYSLPVGRKLNLEFNAGFGYLGGEVREYEPKANTERNDIYIWQKTTRRHWWGPTKVEIALTWLLGRGNVNGKGGSK